MVSLGHNELNVNLSNTSAIQKYIIFNIFRYAYFKKLDYFTTECIYSPQAYRGYARAFIKDAESVRPSAIIGKHAGA